MKAIIAATAVIAVIAFTLGFYHGRLAGIREATHIDHPADHAAACTAFLHDPIQKGCLDKGILQEGRSMKLTDDEIIKLAGEYGKEFDNPIYDGTAYNEPIDSYSEFMFTETELLAYSKALEAELLKVDMEPVYE